MNSKYTTLEDVVLYFIASGDNLKETAEAFGLEYHKAHYARNGEKKPGANAELLFDGTWYSLQKMSVEAYGEYRPKKSRSQYERSIENGKEKNSSNPIVLAKEKQQIYKDSEKSANPPKNFELEIGKIREELDLIEKKLNKSKDIETRVDEIIKEIEENALPFSKNQKQMIKMVMKIGRQNMNELQKKAITLRVQMKKLREKQDVIELERRNKLKEKKMIELVNDIEAKGIKLTEEQKNSLRDKIDKEYV